MQHNETNSNTFFSFKWSCQYTNRYTNFKVILTSLQRHQMQIALSFCCHIVSVNMQHKTDCKMQIE